MKSWVGHCTWVTAKPGKPGKQLCMCVCVCVCVCGWRNVNKIQRNHSSQRTTTTHGHKRKQSGSRSVPAGVSRRAAARRDHNTNDVCLPSRRRRLAAAARGRSAAAAAAGPAAGRFVPRRRRCRRPEASWSRRRRTWDCDVKRPTSPSDERSPSRPRLSRCYVPASPRPADGTDRERETTHSGDHSRQLVTCPPPQT